MSATFTLNVTLSELLGVASSAEGGTVDATTEIVDTVGGADYEQYGNFTIVNGAAVLTLPANDPTNLPYDPEEPAFGFKVRILGRSWSVPAQAADTTHALSSFTDPWSAPISVSAAASLQVQIDSKVGPEAFAQMDVTGKTTAEINTWLSTPGALGLIKRMVGAAVITTNLVAVGGLQLDATGATVTAAVGNRTGLIKNFALAGAGARDAKVRVVGGTWDKNGQTYDGSGAGAKFNGTGIAFHRVDGLHLSDVTCADQGAVTKYAVGLGDVTDFYVGRISLDNTNSDGVHVLGPASNGVIENITGKTHDDMVGITARDYEDWTVGGAHDVTNVVVQNVFPQGSVAAVKLLAGAGAKLSGITVRNISGTTTAAGVYAVDDNFDADTTGGTWDDILIENINLATGAAYAAVRVGATAGTVGTVTIRNVNVSAIAGQAVHLGNAGTNATLGRITIDGITANQLHTSALIAVVNGVQIGTLALRNIRALLKADKTAGYILNTSVGSTISNLNLFDIDVVGGTAGFNFGGVVTTCRIYACTIDAGSGIITSNALTTVTVDGVTQVNGNFVLVSGTGALTLFGGNLTLLNAAATFGRTGAQAVRVNGSSLKVNTAALSGMAVDDMVCNINGALGHGLGVCIVSGGGGLWKNIRTGATN